MRRVGIACVLIAASGAPALAAAPWPGPHDGGGLDGLARCASLYALLGGAEARPDVRLGFERELELHVTLLDAGDRMSRGAPIPGAPELSPAWRDVLLEGIHRYRATVAASLETRGEAATRQFLEAESAHCEALRSGARQFEKPPR